MGREQQIIRHYAIIKSLESFRGATLKDLATNLNVSVKTVRRDLRALEDAGFPIYDDRINNEKRWKLVEESKKSIDIKFTPVELLSIYLSQRLFYPLRNTVLAKPLESVFEKIRCVFTQEKLDDFNQLKNVFDVDHSSYKNYEQCSDIINKIRDAIISTNSLQIKYSSLQRKQKSKRIIDPYQLWLHENNLYVIAFCHMRKQIRLFAVDRITHLEVLTRKFVMRPEFVPENYKREFFNIRRGNTKYEVKIRIKSPWSLWVKEKIWHPTQKLVEYVDESIDIMFSVTELEGIKRWVLGFGASAQVIEPIELRKLIEQEIQNVLISYHPKKE
ncbi:MAG: hypothetical protein A2161_16150 [Candidatus Schekmanbacteria bacterium RBG_13_48_7]|uniref:HTH deoR-type domain-containing protein n=1 Tax=Candidatus Schekmanbacteria bacterium RBG_13_48_7 TaxID=1817878 RepID=A0A1F7RUV5_9BACT|nr:MAG: hypothetical protein A2161_16150 [Candidatus Schekmanbacteria bacterium RBG_13_48_7]